MRRVLMALMCLLAAAVAHAGPVREPVTFTYLGNAGWQKVASPTTRVVIPKYFEPMQFR